MDIVYRLVFGSGGESCVLFAPRGLAQRVAQIRHAFDNSKTWGEFRANLPRGEWSNLASQGVEKWPDGDQFNPDWIPGYSEGDYPEWLRQSQLGWFPRELIEKYDGEESLTTLSGWVLDLPACHAEAIAEELRAMGHSVEKTDLDID